MKSSIFNAKLPMPPIGDVGRIVIAVAAALAVGIGLQSVCDAESQKYITEKLTAPLFDTIMNLLSAVATVMIFTSIISSVGCMGSVSALKDMGLRFVRETFGGILRTCACCALVLPFMFDMLKEEGKLSPRILVSLYEMLLSCIPANVVTPFIEGNALQVVFLGVGIGIIILISGQEVSALSRSINQLNGVMRLAMNYVCRLVPVIVFLSFLGIILEGSLLKVLCSWKIVAAITGLSWLAILGSAVVTAGRCRISLVQLLKNCLPATIQGTMTGASTCCFPQIEQIAGGIYGVKKSLLDFTLPVGSILCAKGQGILYMGVVAGVCELTQVKISHGELLLLIFTAAVIGIACPPIPGAPVAVMGMVFTQFHLPLEALGLVLPVLFVVDMTGAGADTTCMIHDIILLGHDLGRCDDRPVWHE